MPSEAPLDINISTTPAGWELSSDLARFRETIVPKALVIREKKPFVMAIGPKVEELLQKLPKGSEQPGIDSIDPFEAGRFEADTALQTVHHLVQTVRFAFHKDRLRVEKITLPDGTGLEVPTAGPAHEDNISLRLEIADYDRIPEDQRKLFEVRLLLFTTQGRIIGLPEAAQPWRVSWIMRIAAGVLALLTGFLPLVIVPALLRGQDHWSQYVTGGTMSLIAFPVAAAMGFVAFAGRPLETSRLFRRLFLRPRT